MNDEMLIGLSALVDGECSESEAGTAVAAVTHPEGRAAWARYQLIGGAMRGELPRFIDRGFADRLQQSVADEPTVLAPRQRQAPAWLRPVAGVAIAASVAAVAVLRVGSIDTTLSANGTPAAATQMAAATLGGDGTLSALGADPAPTMAVAHPMPASVDVAATPASYSTATMSDWMQASDNAGVIAVAPARSRLNSYLMHYSEQRAMMGSPGVLPYAKVVGYTPEQ